MIRLKAKEQFTLGRFAEIKEIERNNINYCEDGTLYKNDIFVCDEDLAKYLSNEIENPVKRAVVDILEIIPEEKPKKQQKKKKVL